MDQTARRLRLPGRIVRRWNSEGLDLIARGLVGDRGEDFLMRRRLTPERAAELLQWTPGHAARFGYLAGGGISAESILADDAVGVKSLQAVLGLATRWKLSVGTGGLRIVIPMSSRDHELLERAATVRGVSVESIAASLLHIAAAERLIDAILDDH